MPDLGAYAPHVLAAYGITLTLIAGLVALSWRRSERVRRTLSDLETTRRRASHER